MSYFVIWYVTHYKLIQTIIIVESTINILYKMYFTQVTLSLQFDIGA
jgi:hypothetical protein